MKKFILPIIILLTVAFFLPQKVNAQTGTDCHGVFTKESNACLKESTECIDSCVDKGNAAMSLTVDGAKVSLECQRNVCGPASKACDDKAMANFRACQDAKSAQKASAKEVGPGSVEKDGEFPGWELPGKAFGEFIRKVQELRLGKQQEEDNGVGSDKEEFSSQTETNVVNEWIKNNFGELDMKKIEAGPQLERQPIIIKEDQAVVVEAPGQDQFYLGMSYTNGLVKMPDSQEFTDFQDIWHIPTGSTVKATGQPIRINIGTKKVLVIAPGSEAVLTSDRQIDILKGTIEVQKEGIFSRDSKQETGARTEFIDLFVIGTHYWVTHKPGKQTLIGVYEGEVEVKTRDENTIKVKQDGDKPEVVVVSQKLSPLKLALAGLVLVVIVGGVIFIIKKKFASKGFGKKKR